MKVLRWSKTQRHLKQKYILKAQNVLSSHNLESHFGHDIKTKTGEENLQIELLYCGGVWLFLSILVSVFKPSICGLCIYFDGFMY